MQNKQKVTLYIPPDLHRKLKIKAAVDSDTMSSLVERAVSFYIEHSEEVDEIEASTVGGTHQVHFCPDCNAAVVVRGGSLVSLRDQPGIVTEEMPLSLRAGIDSSEGSQGGNLVRC